MSRGSLLAAWIRPGIALFVLCWVALPTRGIVVRHDRPDEQFRKLGEGYPCVGTLVPVGDGAVTLIDPSWVITAAHVAAGMSPFHRTIRFGEKDYLVERVVLHPTWGDRPGVPETIDMALMKLSRPVQGIEPARLYRKKDEVGKEVLFVGWGDTGTGETGPTSRDEVRRGATNIVDSEIGGWITFVFDAPPGGTEHEGISGPGDSGGPAFFLEDGEVFIAGVSASNEPAPGKGACTYASREYYPRVSHQIEWIEKTLAADVEPEAVWSADLLRLDGESGSWPDSPAGRLAGAFFSAMEAGDAATLQEFEEAHAGKVRREGEPLDERVRSWRRRKRSWGPLEVKLGAEAGPYQMFVLVRPGRERRWMTFRFEVEKEKPHGLIELEIRRARGPHTQ